MAKEVERKWLVASTELSELERLSTARHFVRQGYLSIAENGNEVRIRQIGKQYFQTVKSSGGLERFEYEAALPEELFETFWPATAGARIEKTRFLIPLGEQWMIELDVFGGTLEGLVVAEVEFASSESCNDFVAPSWFGREVTDDSRYQNRCLALSGNIPD